MICSFNFLTFLAVCLNISTVINIKILANSNQQTWSYEFTSHIAAFLSVVLITEMLEICIQTSYDQNVQLILKSYLPVVYGTPLSSIHYNKNKCTHLKSCRLISGTEMTHFGRLVVRNVPCITPPTTTANNIALGATTRWYSPFSLIYEVNIWFVPKNIKQNKQTSKRKCNNIKQNKNKNKTKTLWISVSKWYLHLETLK